MSDIMKEASVVRILLGVLAAHRDRRNAPERSAMPRKPPVGYSVGWPWRS